MFSILLVGTLIVAALAAPLEFERRALPIKITVSTAKSYLSQLKVATPSNDPPYQRTLFKHWITISGRCDTRETVLKRDGTGVKTSSSCSVTAGTWVSPYDNVRTNSPLDLDIDHVVPLKEAWVSGAKDWTNTRRQQLANDLTRPQLVAVTDNLNQAKGDQDPSTWLPPLDSFKCSYVVAWIQVKYYYSLAIDSAEKTALTDTISRYC